MNEQQFQFRTAAFGGFNKQDVLNFVEASAQEFAEKEEKLRKELEEAVTTAREAAQQAEDLARQVEALTAERDQLQADRIRWEGQAGEIAAARDQLRAECAELRLRVEKMEPDVAAYTALKERTASIELEAHGRAQIIEREAKEEARKTQAKVGEWFSKVEAAYSRLRTELEATLTHAAGEVQRVEHSLMGISGEFGSYDEGLKAVRQEIETIETPKVPEPLVVDIVDPEG